MCRNKCKPAGFSCAGGVEPRPYGTSGRFYEVADGACEFANAYRTILQSPSATAPFTQGSLTGAHFGGAVQTRGSSECTALLLFRPLRGHLPHMGKALGCAAPLVLPLGELSPQATERVYTYPLRPSLRSATSPKGGGKGCLRFASACKIRSCQPAGGASPSPTLRRNNISSLFTLTSYLVKTSG